MDTPHRRSSAHLSRRRVLVFGGMAGGAIVLGACGSTDVGGATLSADANNTTPQPGCVLVPSEIEGPFYTDLNLVRRDITDGKPGSSLEMRITVVDAATCAAIPDATVDIWHADAGGLYSAFPEQGDDEDIDMSERSFLRGVQPTDAAGTATFTTIYPGWYSGRTTHVHVKVHLSDRTLVTTQLYFADDITEAVYAGHDAYAERGPKDTPNDDDEFSAELASLRMGVVELADGHRATHVLGVRR